MRKCYFAVEIQYKLVIYHFIKICPGEHSFSVISKSSFVQWWQQLSNFLITWTPKITHKFMHPSSLLASSSAHCCKSLSGSTVRVKTYRALQFSASTLCYKMFLYSHDKVCEMFCQLQQHLMKALILSLIDLWRLYLDKTTVKVILEKLFTTHSVGQNPQFEKPWINRQLWIMREMLWDIVR
jgi:hypothetical protein